MSSSKFKRHGKEEGQLSHNCDKQENITETKTLLQMMLRICWLQKRQNKRIKKTY